MNAEIRRILEIANEFLRIPSSTFYEKPFLDYLSKRIRSLGYDVEEDVRFIVVKPRDVVPKSLFSVHIDRNSVIKNVKTNEIEYLAFYLKKENKIGFKRDERSKNEKKIVAKLNSDGYQARLAENHFVLKKDGIVTRFVLEGTLSFFEKVGLRYVGCPVVSYRPDSGILMNEYDIARYDIDHKRFDVRYQVRGELKVDDVVFMMKSQISVCDDIFYGQIDNVISVAIMFYILEKGDFCDEVIFTTQEEIGKSFECVVSYLERLSEKRRLIVLDTSPYENFKSYDEGFVVLRRGDENGNFDKKIIEEIEQFLIDEEIPYHFKPSDKGSTELGRVVQHTKGKINGCTLQLPSMNYHTTYETSTLKSLENYYRIISQIVNK